MDNTLQTDLAACVEATHCNCHPETCCCGDHTLTIGGEKVATGSRDRMQRIADAINGHAPAIAELQARCEAAERDAARYRWLRANDGADMLAEDVVDDAIDASREVGNG